MRIDRVDVFRVVLPVRDGPYRMSLTEVTSLDSTVVAVRGDDGTVGYGEVCPLGPTYQDQHAAGARAALSEIGPALLGLDPRLGELVGARMDQALRGHRYAKSAVDVACWDLAARAQGSRVCDLLGGARRDRVPAYRVVGIGSPVEAAAAARSREAEGFGRLQIKVGGRSVEEDVATLEAVAAALQPSTQIVADANRGWTTSDAVLVSEACHDITMTIEQPCETYQQCVSLRGRLRHPLFLDEVIDSTDAVLTAIAEGVADGFGLKVSRMGGLSAMRTIRDICRARRLPHTVEDSWGGDIAAAACVHLAATVEPTLLEAVWIAAPYVDGHIDRGGGIVDAGGWIDVPTGPGLGVVPDPQALGEPVMSFS